MLENGDFPTTPRPTSQAIDDKATTQRPAPGPVATASPQPTPAEAGSLAPVTNADLLSIQLASDPQLSPQNT